MSTSYAGLGLGYCDLVFRFIDFLSRGFSNGRDQLGYPDQEIVRLTAFGQLAGRLS
jgi:hypothetical protein